MSTATVTPKKFEGFKLLTMITNDPPNVDLNWLWGKVSTQDYAFDDMSRGRPEAFCQLLLNSSNRLFLIGDYGLFLVQNIIPQGDCSIHFVVWDRNFSLQTDREYAYELLDWLFYEVGVHRVSGYIPVYNRLAPRFALAMGMKFEGEMREVILWKGQYHNVKCFGLLEVDYRLRKGRLLQ